MNGGAAPVQRQRQAMSPTAIVSALARVEGWTLNGDGAAVAIEKRFRFANYHETLAFVNAVAFIAHQQDHHPHLGVDHNACLVRYHTHDAGGLTASDFDAAARVDALLAPR